jgi:putative heme-binding domain-containing protein
MANRQAKKYGIITGMACFEAKRLCPAGVLCKPHYDEYRRLSLAMFKILEDYAPVLVPMSIDEGFLDFSTMDAQEFTGIITAETPDYVTLTQPGGIVETVPRRYLEKITSSKISLMPDGFEGALSKQAMADLIAYIGNRRN